ncbi:MAG: PadR family transcriptional regulator [Candidatus Eisenbacteria bacterium]|jgi:DNA-binding PadR family transcriptional regulator|nr:PadR family transcriptional regulator [Candidatus Eisenbacteria bacterium]
MEAPRVEVINLTRSCNEALILTLLREGPMHGYQLAFECEQRGGGVFAFKHGTLYPILHKLEKDGLIQGIWSDEGPRGKRKCYTLTDRGSRYARIQRESWRAFITQFMGVIGKEET